MSAKPRVLVVESDPEARRLITTALLAFDADPHAVESSDGIDPLLQEEKFDGIFLDWCEPAAKQVLCIRQSERNRATPIIAMSGSNERQAINQSFQAGANFFLSRPLTASKVQRLLAVSRGLILEERREFQRARISLPVDCHCEQGVIAGTTLDLSSRGMLLKADRSCPARAKVELAFTLPGEPALGLHSAGEVVRVTPTGEMGIRFLELSKSDRQQIADFVERFLAERRQVEPPPEPVVV